MGHRIEGDEVIELVGQPRGHELPHVFGAAEIAQSVFAQRSKVEAVTRLVDGEVAGRSRHQHLATVADVADRAVRMMAWSA